MDKKELRAGLEALLFATDRPLRLEEAAEILGDEAVEGLQEALDDLLTEYSHPDRGLQILKVAGGYRIGTRPEQGNRIRALYRYRNRYRLSPAALETLALVAYRQPITAVEIQDMRGTCSASVLKTLLERKLIRLSGRKRVIGRPILYSTGVDFLTHFGLNRLDDLPRLGDLENETVTLPEEEPTEGEESGSNPS